MSDQTDTLRDKMDALEMFLADIAFPDWVREHFDALAARLAEAEAARDRIREALERLVADIETNSEAGAPDYAFAALAVPPSVSPGEDV